MARIKVTGYILTDDLEPDHVDLNSETGLSEEGFEELSELFDLEGLTFELQNA